MKRPSSIYLFRSAGYAANGDTIVSAAPIDLVVSAYGGGGLKGEAGLVQAFGGAAFFRDEETGDRYFGIWGARKASRFRTALQAARADLEVIHGPPPARLIWRTTTAPPSRRDRLPNDRGGERGAAKDRKWT